MVSEPVACLAWGESSDGTAGDSFLIIASPSGGRVKVDPADLDRSGDKYGECSDIIERIKAARTKRRKWEQKVIRLIKSVAKSRGSRCYTDLKEYREYIDRLNHFYPPGSGVIQIELTRDEMIILKSVALK